MSTAIGSLRYSANMSMIFGDLPMPARPAAAAAEGFRYVESWWPFDRPVPPSGEVDEFCQALTRAGVRLVALNLDAGDLGEGDRGLLSRPGLDERILGNLDVAMEIVGRTGCQVVNALWGNREAPYSPEAQDRAAFDRLVRIADRVASAGGSVVVETLNTHDSPAFPLTDIHVTAQIVRRANEAGRHGNVGLLLDTYHLAMMGTDPVGAIRRYGPLIRHVQFADAPGRGRPGTGGLDFPAIEAALREVGYAGHVGLEYTTPRIRKDQSREDRELRT